MYILTCRGSGLNNGSTLMMQEMIFKAGQLLLEDPEGNVNSKCGRQLNVSLIFFFSAPGLIAAWGLAFSA